MKFRLLYTGCHGYFMLCWWVVNFEVIITFLLHFTVAFASARGEFGPGIGPVLFFNVDCEGDEGTVLNCSYSTPTNSLSHDGDTGVRCFNNTG